jgi:hypothetical protein
MQDSHSEKSYCQIDPSRLSIAMTVLPSLLALWCCLSVLQQRASDIPPIQTLLATVVPVLATVWVLHGLVFLFCRSRELSVVATLIVVSFIGLHGPVAAIFTMGHRTFDKSFFFYVWLAIHTVVLAGLFVVVRKKVLVQRIAKAMTVALAFMVSLQVVNVALPFIADSSRTNELDQLVDRDSPIAPDTQFVAGTEAAPDIYYLIVDAYARQDVLKEIYGFDNSDFIQSLRSRGFYVGDESRSNYNYTEYSLASSLNMSHLHDFNLTAYQTRMPLRHLIRNSLVTKSLSSSGYRTYAIETGKSETECDNFDHYVPFGQALNDYQDVLYHGTPLPKLLELTGWFRSAARRHGDRVMFAFEQVPQLAASSEDPAFVFCHVLAPHPPFLFDANGNEVEFRGHYLLSDCRNFTSCYDYDLEVYRKQYREQLAHINSRLIEVIDRIQSSERESIIILQADHGPRLGFGFQYEGGEPTCQWRHRETFSILNAIAMPGQQDHGFYSSMTPVNTFRLVFNKLFGTQLPTLPDDSFSVKRYEFTRVTDEAQPLNEINNASSSDLANHQQTHSSSPTSESLRNIQINN